MAEFDFIVVGSGAAGAAASWNLCKKGYKVACVEQGEWMDPSKYPSTEVDWENKKLVPYSPLPNVRRRFADYPIDDSESPIAPCNFNAVGGSTILYSGHFPRFKPEDFAIGDIDNTSYNWPIQYGDLIPYYEINEKQMGVAGLVGDPMYPEISGLLPPVPLGDSGELLAKAFNAKGWHWWPSYSAISTRAFGDRNQCINLGPCNTGCPQGAKSSVDVTYIPRALQLGLVLIANTAVSHLIVDNERISGVCVISKDRSKKILTAKHFILAASALGTPRILLNSKDDRHPKGLCNSNGLVGKNLMLHPLGYVEGVFNQQLDTDIGPQGCMLYSLEHHRSIGSEHHLGYMMHVLRGTGPLEAAMSAYSRRKLQFGENLYQNFFDIYKKQLVISIICEDLPRITNYVTNNEKECDSFGIPSVKVFYELDDNTRKMMSHGMSKAREIMITAGAKKIYAHGPVRNSGWHIMGTTRMGSNPNNSIVNEYGKTHEIDNLYIVDSSIFVTGSCVNPANTIQALALYITDKF